MHIGSLTIELMFHSANSLKDKRSILKSLIETTRRKFNISIAEVDEHDKWRKAVIGIACVSNDPRFLNSVLDSVVAHIEANPLLEVGAVEMEIF